MLVQLNYIPPWQITQANIIHHPRSVLLSYLCALITLKPLQLEGKRTQSPTEAPTNFSENQMLKYETVSRSSAVIPIAHKRGAAKTLTLPAIMIQQSLVTLCLATSLNRKIFAPAMADYYALRQNPPLNHLHPKIPKSQLNRTMKTTKRKRLGYGWTAADSPALRFRRDGSSSGR
jgi:hypothetical protein